MATALAPSKSSWGIFKLFPHCCYYCCCRGKFVCVILIPLKCADSMEINLQTTKREGERRQMGDGVEVVVTIKIFSLLIYFTCILFRFFISFTSFFLSVFYCALIKCVNFLNFLIECDKCLRKLNETSAEDDKRIYVALHSTMATITTSCCYLSSCCCCCHWLCPQSLQHKLVNSF